MRDGGDGSDVTLPGAVRDHLGQQLRGALAEGEDRPRYLGDDPVPDTFAPQLSRLETRLKTYETGTGAVEEALDRILDALGLDPDRPAR